MVKKILIALGVLIVLLLASAVVLPILFKDDIIKLATTEANKQLKAEVALGDIDLSMFTNFPDFTLRIENIKVTNQAPFEGVELANIQAVVLSLDLMSVIGGEKIEIKTVGLEKPNLHVIVLPDGTANYDITKPSDEPEVEEEPETTDTGSTSFAIGLQEYFIEGANIIYDDRAGGMYANLKNFTHKGSGDFTQDDFLLSTRTTADAITFRMDGTPYLNRTELEMKFDMNMNLPNMRFEFVENFVRLNALQLGFDGSVAMPPNEADGPIDLDIKFNTKETSFKSLLSMVPAIFLKDFEDIETAGELALDGFAKGRMVGDQLPAFALNLVVSDAMFHYPDLPESAENIAIDLHVNNPGGSDDNTIVDLKKFHVEMAKNPVDLTLYMTTPISDPFIRAALMADVDLASLSAVIPMEEGQSVTGKVKSDIQLEARQSAIDNEQYDQVKADGSLALENIDYKDPAIAYETIIKVCNLNFSPQFAELTALQVKAGRSDIAMNGRVDNIVSWYVANEPLSGAFNLSSNLLDLNEFMGDGDDAEKEEIEEEVESEEDGGVAEIPAGFNFTLTTDIKKLIYDNIDITNVKGEVKMADQRASMNGLAMNLMDGGLAMNGYYETKNPIEPAMDFKLDITNWNVVKTFETFESMKKMAPIMENATGNFSTGLQITGLLDQHMDPKYNTLDGGGLLQTHNIEVKSPNALVKLANAINYDKLKEVTLNNVDISYYFEDGRIKLDPFDFNMGGDTKANFGGSHGFDQTLDYVLKLDAPSKALGGAANQAVSGLFSKANQALGTNASMPERVKMDVLIGGTSDDPKVTPQLAGMSAASAKDALKDKAKEEINKKKEELENKAKEEVDKAKQEAEAKKKEAEDRARKEAADAKKKAAAEKKKAEDEARKKAEAEKKKAEAAAKKKAEDEAKKKLKGVFK